MIWIPDSAPVAVQPNRTSTLSKELNMDRAEILRKLAAGELTVDETTALLSGDTSKSEQSDSATEPQTNEASATSSPDPRSESAEKPARKAGGVRWLHVRVSDLKTQRDRVTVNLPFALVKAGIRIGSRFTKQFSDSEWTNLIAAMESGTESLVEVEDFDSGERIQIYVD